MVRDGALSMRSMRIKASTRPRNERRGVPAAAHNALSARAHDYSIRRRRGRSITAADATRAVIAASLYRHSPTQPRDVGMPRDCGFGRVGTRPKTDLVTMRRIGGG